MLSINETNSLYDYFNNKNNYIITYKAPNDVISIDKFFKNNYMTKYYNIYNENFINLFGQENCENLWALEMKYFLNYFKHATLHIDFINYKFSILKTITHGTYMPIWWLEEKNKHIIVYKALINKYIIFRQDNRMSYMLAYNKNEYNFIEAITNTKHFSKYEFSINLLERDFVYNKHKVIFKDFLSYNNVNNIIQLKKYIIENCSQHLFFFYNNRPYATKGSLDNYWDIEIFHQRFNEEKWYKSFNILKII